METRGQRAAAALVEGKRQRFAAALFVATDDAGDLPRGVDDHLAHLPRHGAEGGAPVVAIDDEDPLAGRCGRLGE